MRVGEIIHGTVAPPPIVQAPQVTHHMQGRVNPKDIRETELYQENYPNERVFEGGTLAGMPLDSLNRPLATVSGVAKPVSAPIIQETLAQPTTLATGCILPQSTVQEVSAPIRQEYQ